MITVAIAEDMPIFRESLKFLLEQDPDISVVACAANGKEAHELCAKHHPDLLLLDIMMPVIDGIEGTRIVKKDFPEIKVLILTTFKDSEKILEAMRHGADGYLLKDVNTPELILTIKNVAAGMQVFHPESYRVLKETLARPETQGSSADADAVRQLTGKEKEIIKLIVYGQSNKEIASTMEQSPGSVRNAISAILAKLNLKDRTQLAVFAVKSNLV